jgi:hypothetical protein
MGGVYIGLDMATDNAECHLGYGRTGGDLSVYV